MVRCNRTLLNMRYNITICFLFCRPLEAPSQFIQRKRARLAKSSRYATVGREMASHFFRVHPHRGRAQNNSRHRSQAAFGELLIVVTASWLLAIVAGRSITIYAEGRAACRDVLAAPVPRTAWTAGRPTCIDGMPPSIAIDQTNTVPHLALDRRHDDLELERSPEAVSSPRAAQLFCRNCSKPVFSISAVAGHPPDSNSDDESHFYRTDCSSPSRPAIPKISPSARSSLLLAAFLHEIPGRDRAPHFEVIQDRASKTRRATSRASSKRSKPH